MVRSRYFLRPCARFIHGKALLSRDRRHGNEERLVVARRAALAFEPVGPTFLQQHETACRRRANRDTRCSRVRAVMRRHGRFHRSEGFTDRSSAHALRPADSRHALRVCQRHLRPTAEEQSNRVEASASHRSHQRGITESILVVDLSAPIEELTHHLDIPIGRGDAERGILGIAEPEAHTGADELRDQTGVAALKRSLEEHGRVMALRTHASVSGKQVEARLMIRPSLRPAMP